MVSFRDFLVNEFRADCMHDNVGRGVVVKEKSFSNTYSAVELFHFPPRRQSVYFVMWNRSDVLDFAKFKGLLAMDTMTRQNELISLMWGWEIRWN